MIVALILLAVALGSVLFHFLSPWWWTPIASNWGFIDTTIIITFWITGVVFIAIILFMAYCVWKFRQGSQAEYRPENRKLEVWLTVLTSIGVIGMLAPGLIVWNDFVNVPDDATEVEVMGQQWQWSYRLPGEDGVLGASDIRSVDFDNPFGLDRSDPNGKDDILVPVGAELYLPVDKPVKVLLRSLDVLHNFYVPEFRGKMDLVPGMVTYFWFTPTKTGTYEVLCAELCGVGHHIMRGTVVVADETDYLAWLQEQQTFGQSIAQASAPDPDTGRLEAAAPEQHEPELATAAQADMPDEQNSEGAN